MDRLIDDFGLGRGWLSPRWARTALPWHGRSEWSAWTPEIEMVQQGDKLIVRADLPGLKKEDVHIEVKDDRITIRGERKREHEEEKNGVYRSERSYGSFTRVVQLPEGAMTDQAKASFHNGVLEIAMPAPPEHERRGRRLEIMEGTASKDMSKN
jgi:HSP20 family protein